MNYILIEVTPDGNGVSDRERQIAISRDRPKLERYCYNTFGLLVGKPAKFSWDSYYIIKDTEINMVD